MSSVIESKVRIQKENFSVSDEIEAMKVADAEAAQTQKMLEMAQQGAEVAKTVSDVDMGEVVDA